MLIYRLDGGELAKVDAGARRHYRGVVEELADAYGVIDRVEGYDDAAEGFEWGEGMQGHLLGEESADLGDGGGVKD